VIKFFLFIVFSLFLVNCSLNENSKIWNKNNKNPNDNQNIKLILSDKKISSKELNTNLILDLSKIKITNESSENRNNLGSQNYTGEFNKIGNFKFSKFDETNEMNFKPLFLKDGLIFFDKKGSIIKYDYNQKIIWKKNYYSKHEKKIGPKLTFSSSGENLIITDNIAKFYVINLNNGDLLWKKINEYPFNSEIKIFGDKFFVVDLKNTLRCFFIKEGTECWNLPTDNSIIVSDTKNSLIIENDLIIFNNKIGDVTAVEISSGSIVWQIPTQSFEIINNTHNFKNSKLVSDGNSIYFSNNKSEFYSINIKNGSVNWIKNINSSLTPIIYGNLIYTISDNGFFHVIEKNKGNIIKINDVYKSYKIKKRKNLKPTGFSISQDKLYLSNNDGKLIVVKLDSGNISKIVKISKNIISKPFIYDNNLFIVKNGSIIQYN